MSPAEHEALLAEQVKEHRDASLQGHAERLGETTGQPISLMTMRRTLLRFGIMKEKPKAAERT